MGVLFAIATGIITALPSNSGNNPNNLTGAAPVPHGLSGYVPSALQFLNPASIVLIAIAILLIFGLFVYWRRVKRRN